VDHQVELYYSIDHEWIRVEGLDGTVGVTDFAQRELTDVVAVELPEEGTTVSQGEPFGAIEAIKAFSDLISPVSGTVTAVNTELLDHPEWVNEDPYGHGWMIEIRMSNLAEIDTLLSSQYEGEIGEA